jgi:hypothetical protein
VSSPPCETINSELVSTQESLEKAPIEGKREETRSLKTFFHTDPLKKPSARQKDEVRHSQEERRRRRRHGDDCLPLLLPFDDEIPLSPSFHPKWASSSSSRVSRRESSEILKSHNNVANLRRYVFLWFCFWCNLFSVQFVERS